MEERGNRGSRRKPLNPLNRALNNWSQNNSEKSLLRILSYDYTKLEQQFATVLHTNMVVPSREWKPRVVTLVEEYSFWRLTVLETWLFWSYCQGFFHDFHQHHKGRGTSGLAQSWSQERLPVKSSTVNSPNTCDQDCRYRLHYRWFSLCVTQAITLLLLNKI